MKCAQIVFKLDRHGSRFDVQGPPELLLEMACRGYKEYDFNGHITRHCLAWDDWGVNCSVTGEWIALNDLNYWDTETQQAFKDHIVAMEYAKSKNWFKGVKNDKDS